ncbi:hypothetical protein OPT61_g8958 [Boeremia exigua]|uniref:Uncharacterized protein n=1 Tax=Boeremia exigua TaxID=749465 RepID=A0ACC2HW31_9PLEO|nr:hypothetical protein OPT61_g8958 [Boeremia exigua]
MAFGAFQGSRRHAAASTPCSRLARKWRLMMIVARKALLQAEHVIPPPESVSTPDNHVVATIRSVALW